MTREPEPTVDLLDPPTPPDDTLDGPELPALTVFDRCDAAGCTAQAYVRAQLRSGLHLVFCGHHGHELTPALVGQGAVLRDDTHVLVEDRMRNPIS